MKTKKKSLLRGVKKKSSKSSPTRNNGKVLPLKKNPKMEKKSSGKNKKVFQKKYFRRKNDVYLRNGNTKFMFDFKLETENAKVPFRRKSDLERCEKMDDSELVKIIIQQNPEAYRILFKRYEKSLYIYMFHMVRNKEEVEDLLQNVFTKTFKSLSRFDTERKFSSWVYRIAHNEAVNFIKRRSKRQLVSWEDVSTSKDKLVISVEDEDAAEIFMHKEISEEIDKALNSIPEKYKKILMLRYFEEYSYEKIGKILGKPVNTVGTLINRAKKKLFEVVNEERGK